MKWKRLSVRIIWLVPVVLMVVAAVTNRAWLLALALGWLVIWSVVAGAINLQRVERRERYRRWLDGCCVQCGYSLQGNTSGVCPECGTRVPRRPTAEELRPRRTVFKTR